MFKIYIFVMQPSIGSIVLRSKIFNSSICVSPEDNKYWDSRNAIRNTEIYTRLVGNIGNPMI